MPTRETYPPTDPETRRLFAALAIASGRPEDRIAPDFRMPYVADVFAMLRGERPPADDRERRALKFYGPSPAPPSAAGAVGDTFALAV